MTYKYSLISAFLFLLSSYGFAAEWYVGATRTYTLPSQIVNLVADNDTIYLDGGIYLNDAAKWTKKNLKFIGLGTGSNRSILRYTGDIPNGKGIFVFELPGTSDNPYLENLVFDGAQVSDANGGNGAGIRFQAKNITIVNCHFLNCQNGILEGNGGVTTSNVTIRDSEFENNGYQLPNDPTHSGYEHHIYIGASTDTLLVQNCYFHHPRGQANSIKTRAQRSYILYNLIDEGATGYGSWELNIAQGGLNVIMGNVIIQGPAGANHGIIGYDAATNVLEDFYFVNNTVINQFAGNIKYFNTVPASGINTYKIYNNIFASVPGASNTVFSGNIPVALDSAGNALSVNYNTFGFTNATTGDYSLTSGATAAIDQGVNAGSTSTAYSLIPMYAYQSNSSPLVPRMMSGTAIDIGAYEFELPSTAGIDPGYLSEDIQVYPNPSTGIFHIHFPSLPGEAGKLEVYDAQGVLVLSNTSVNGASEYQLDLSLSPKGLYLLKISNGVTLTSKTLVIR
jgi:hypothetical protein